MELTHSVAINDTFSLKWRYYGPKGIFWAIGEHLQLVYYPIISYQRIKVNRAETMDMGISRWNNGVSGKIMLEQWCQWKMQYQ